MQGIRRYFLALVAGLTLVLGGLALTSPARAGTFTDTQLAASPPESVASVAFTAPASSSSHVVTAGLSCSAVDAAPVAFSGPTGWTLTTGGACPGSFSATPPSGVGAGTYIFVVTASPNPSHNAVEKSVVVLTIPTGGGGDSVASFDQTMSIPPNTTYPDIKFSGHMTIDCSGVWTTATGVDPNPCSELAGGTYEATLVTSGSVEDAPVVTAVNPSSGLASSGNALTAAGSTLAPGTYTFSTITGTADGAVASETFSLTVTAESAPGSLGDEVNIFGNGPDVFGQHYHFGAIIAGWTATQADPATLFVRIQHGNAWQFEATKNGGAATGLCVSDPGGGIASDPLRDGLILSGCNNGPFQQFVPQSDGSLKNVATGLFVSPNGTGAQLRGTTVPVSWGGSFYHWVQKADLPL